MSAMDVDAFQLSAVVSGHEQDVRSVGGFGDLLLTASRDASVRVWKRADAGSAFDLAASKNSDPEDRKIV